MSNLIQKTTYKAFESIGRNAVSDDEASTMTKQELREAGRQDTKALARWAGASAVVLAGGAGLIAHEAQSTMQEMQQEEQPSGVVFNESINDEIQQEQLPQGDEIKSGAVNQVPEILTSELNPSDITL